MRPLAPVLAPLLMVAWSGRAQDAAELEVDHNVTSAFVTPHTAWAKPYAPGTTRVLFFVNGRGTNPREVIELTQRFDFEPQMVFWAPVIDSPQEGWHGGERGIQRMARLLTREWDAFVFIDLSPDRLPLEQQVPVVRAVTDGAGLVLIGTDDKRVLKDKNELPELPAFLDDVEGVAAFTVMRGRGVRLPPRAKIQYRRGWAVDYDEWDMRLGKAVLWAAGKEPKLGLTLEPEGPELARSTLPGVAATLRWRGGKTATAEVVLRREDGAAIPLPRRKLGRAGGAIALAIPVVRAGSYYLDVIARSGRRVAGFGSVPFAVVSERTVESLVLDQDWSEIGGRLTGRATLSGPGTVDERLAVSLLDRRGRIVARQASVADAGGRAFSFEVQPWFPMLLEVRATLMDDAHEVASAWQFARVVKRHRGRFNFIMWDIPRGNLAPWVEQALADTGVTIHLDAGGYARSDATPPPFFAAYEMGWLPYTTHLFAKKDEKGVMEPACWADETRIQAHVDRIVDKHVSTRRHGVFLYSLGDEIAVRGSCLSPHCLKAYREYLLEQYGDIAALNASWDSNYANVAEVQLSKPHDNEEAEALRTGNLPRWFDRQAFQSHNFCKLCERFGEGFRRIDPQSRCGFEGAGRFGAADDLDGFVRSNAFWTPYPGTADEVLRSIAPRDFPRSNWMGYTKDADTLLGKYWRMITRGCDAVWWWRWDALGRFHGWLAPTLDPYPAVKEILRDTEIVRDGLGDLLISAEMQTDGIGILYSLPSAYAAKVQSSLTYGSYESNHTAFHSALRELGCNFLYFTDRQMRLGEVDLSKFRVIILPMTQAMGRREVEMLRQYVREGGMLIADVRPAIYDGHVKRLAAGQLDDVFGIERTGFGNALQADGVIDRHSINTKSGPTKALDLPGLLVDGGVRAAGASVSGKAGGTPLWLSHRFGEGWVVLLNMPMSTYPELGSDETPETAGGLLEPILRGPAPAVRLTDEDGRRLRNVEVTRWQDGPVQIVSVFRHAGEAERAIVHLPTAMHVYDLKARKKVGKRQTFSLRITPYRASFFALSPRALEPVVLTAAPTVARGTAQRVLIASRAPDARQAVAVKVKLPDGRTADWVDRVVLADGDGAALDVPVAFNDPPGRWTIAATELYTGRTTTKRFTVGK